MSPSLPDAIAGLGELPWTWIAIRASGVTAWALLTAVVAWGILLRTRLLGTKATPPVLLTMHRWLGAVALTFLAVHLVLLLVDPKVSFTIPQLLVPGLAPWQPLAVGFGIVAMWLLLPVTIIGRIRTRLGKAGTALFKRTHVMAYAAWPLATAHYVMAGTDAFSEWSLALLISGSIVLVFLLLARGFVPAPTTRTPPAPRNRPAIAGERAGATINAPRETVSA